ncbi:MAG: hypothetical protein J1G06_06880 [Oscillospiraceae bacterium]|nr:hypothetical protein [Oscillospiraceae bacterium]
MKKLISCAISLSMLCSSLAGLTLSARAEGDVVFKHQNIVNSSQTCYNDDTDEKTVTADNLQSILSLYQGIRINQPVFRAEGLTAGKSYTVKQELKDGTPVKEETVTASSSGILEFKHARNCEMIEIFDGTAVVASLGTEKSYINGVMITYAPMSWQVFQRDENDKAAFTIKGETETDATTVSVDVDGSEEAVEISNKAFTYTKELAVGHHTITVKSDSGIVATYENVAVGDLWVAAGQSNMTDMGAITDGFKPDEQDPINDNMHIIYAEDTTWHKMSHPAGEGRFFKGGVRTSPVTSFAREISASENVPVGIVQSSVGGTNIWQWIDGIRNDPSSGYLIKALESCFDKMPSHNVKGILWYQGCNDAMYENYAYDYKNLQQKLFDEMRSFFGEVPIITTQINDANQDSTGQLGYYDAWSFVKDIQRQNEELYDNVYVVGTSEQELGDTIHNNTASNVILGNKWAKAARNVAYGENVAFRQPTIESATVTGDREITLVFKNTNGLKAATGTKRMGIANNNYYSVELGDLKKEFVVRKGGNKVMTASNSGKGAELAIADVEIINEAPTVPTDDPETTEPPVIDETEIAKVLKDGSTITRVVVNSVDETNANLIIAQYNNNVLSAVKAIPVTLSQGENSKDVNVPMIDGSETKVFLWDALSDADGTGMKPLAGVQTNITDVNDDNSDDDNNDNNDRNGTATVIITTEEELAGVVAVDCLYGKRFVPTLVDAETNESVLAFYNVIASYKDAVEVTPAKEIIASDTAYYKESDKVASDEKMYVNKYQGMNAMALMKFDLDGIDLSKIASASLAVYGTDIDKDRAGNITISEISASGWDSSSVYGNPDYNSLKVQDIEVINSNTAGIFPVGNYSSVDISDYLRSYTGDSIGIGVSSDYASVLTLAGVRSDNPPKLIIQPGHKAELIYTCDGVPCAGMEVTIEAVGATEYSTTTFVTDENGAITLYLTEGSYRAITEKEIGEREASNNVFTVSDGDVTEIYELEKNTEEKPAPPENPIYTFGESYLVIKDFDQTSLADAAIGKTGLTVSTSSTNWNNAVVREKSSPNTGYYPYGTGLPENGYYLFLGSGGNGNVAATLKLPNPVSAGKYIKITYAKPYATNNGSANRNSGNPDDKIAIGTEVIDLQANCDFDTWYTTAIPVTTELSQLDITLGAWAAMAISKIEVSDTAE